MSGQREIKTLTYPNAIVRVHFPALTDEEHKKRMKQIHKAAEDLLKEAVKHEVKR
jgi:ribosome recycling factor